MGRFLFVAGCVLGLNMMAFAQENEEDKQHEALVHEHEVLMQQREAGMQCDLELLEHGQQACGCRLDELERDEQLLEQQTAYRQLEQRRKDEALQKRRQREVRWERDHARE